MNRILLAHELRQGHKSLAIWTSSIAFFIVICIMMFPQISSQMEGVNDIFASMGAFSEAFGMDRLNFGTLIGFYSVECGNILGLGGAMFAAITGISILSKEESGRSAEFLFSHPVSRCHVITSKLMAMIVQIIVLNIMVFLITLLTILAIGETVPWNALALLHSAFLCAQIEIACICFGISAFIRQSGTGIGIGIALILYFMNIVANINDNAAFLEYLSPFSYCEAADIVQSSSLESDKLAIGLLLALTGVATAYLHYSSKDIRA